MKKKSKGDYGYIAARKKQLIVLVILMLAIVFAIYFGAYAYFGTNQNLFTILAALICLPTAKFVVSMIMFCRAAGCSEAAYRTIRDHEQGLDVAYDLYMTSERENYALSHVTVANGSVIALTEDGKCNTGNGQIHIRKMMQGNGLHGYTVKIFDSLSSYVQRLDALGQAVTQDENHGKNEEVLQLLQQISL